MLAISTVVFFAHNGIDSVANITDEVKNPQYDLPLGIRLALSHGCHYMC